MEREVTNKYFLFFRAGIAKQLAAQIIVKTTNNYFANAKSSTVKNVHFVLCDTESVGIYTAELGKLDK